MSYVVNWQEGDGTAGWHSVAEIGDAVAHVEALRNGQGVEGARIFRLDEVEFHLKPYFRVELAASLQPSSVAAAVAAAVPATAATPAPAPATPATPAPVAADAARPVHGDASWVDAAWPEPEAPSTDGALEAAGDGGANGTHRRGLFGR